MSEKIMESKKSEKFEFQNLIFVIHNKIVDCERILQRILTYLQPTGGGTYQVPPSLTYNTTDTDDG